MQNNVGKFDRIIRVLVGLIILSLVFLGPRSAWGWLGLIPLLTGAMGMCPIYSLLGFNTCSYTTTSKQS